MSHEPRARTGARLVVAALVAAAVLAAGAAAWIIHSGGKGARGAGAPVAPAAHPPAEPARQSAPPLSATFTAAGYVEVIPPGARLISSLIPGMLDDIMVQEGQAVQAGDIVATLDTALLEQERLRREAELAVLQARFARLEAGYLPEEIAQAEARAVAAAERLKIAERALDGHRELERAGIASQQLLLAAQAEVVEAVRSVAEAEAEVQMKRRGTRREDIRIAGAELARAAADLDFIKWQIERSVIRSPIDGVVFQQLAQPGQWLTGESAIASIFDPRSVQAWVDVNQRDLARIRLGQRVTMVADAAPTGGAGGAGGRPIEGRVIQFMPRASIERNTVRVKIAIEGEHEGLRPDMSLRVTFHE